MKTSEYELLTDGDEQLKPPPNYSVQPLRLPTATAAASSYRLRSSCYDKQRPGSWCCLVTSQHSCVVTKQQCIIACHHLCVWHKFSIKRTQMISLDRLFLNPGVVISSFRVISVISSQGQETSFPVQFISVVAHLTTLRWSDPKTSALILPRTKT